MTSTSKDGGGRGCSHPRRRLVDLSKPGIERFITLIRDTTEGLAALPEADQRYLDSHGFAVEVVGDGMHTGVVLKQMQLPQGKFNHPAADVLVILPPGYPDVAPGYVLLRPWLTLVSADHPTCADQPRIHGPQLATLVSPQHQLAAGCRWSVHDDQAHRARTGGRPSDVRSAGHHLAFESHEAALRSFTGKRGTEAAAYVLFGKAEIAADPVVKQPRIRLISHEVVPITSDENGFVLLDACDVVDAGFMRLLGLAQHRNLVPGLVHTSWGERVLSPTRTTATKLS